MRRAWVALALLGLACASAHSRREPPPPAPSDRTNDPEFVAALEDAERDFETQADALAAGVYEPFVHPDSVRPYAPPAEADAPPAAPSLDYGPGDPTTEELLRTLSPPRPYNQGQDRPPAGEVAPPLGGVAWTLQVGAFGAETGALVRLRQLARDFPDWPRWHVGDAGIFRVYLGRFGDREAADRARDEASDRGYGDVWVVPAP